MHQGCSKPGVRGLGQFCSTPWARRWGTGLLPFVKHICHSKKSTGSELGAESRGLGLSLCSMFGYKGLE